MLDHVWIIPLIPAVTFWVILFVGKRLPKQGAEIGVAALVACFVLSIVVAGQWISRDETVPVQHHTTTEHEAASTNATAARLAAVGAREAPATSASRAARSAATQSEAEGAETELKRAPVVGGEFTWFQFGGVKVTAGFLVDGLTVALLLVVSTISLMVHIFSTEYLRDDRRKTHYFAFLSLFTTGMFVLVTANTTLQMLLGWEIMGVCSFALIGHWWEEKANSDAALKAFFTTRTGDIGLLVGLGMLFFLAGHSFDIGQTNAMAYGGQMGPTVLTVAACALLVAVIGKSAQFPLHTWLPDAMAGPTPVSALIHAATMVVAGVFLIARLYGVFWQGFHIGAGDGYTPIAMVGGVTIIIAAALAFVQADIKKVLAYSTVSQLGYMVMALGVGGWTAGVFHLFTHAFFKACLFLGAGSVSHSGSHHSFDMKKDMGGLKRYMPVTFWTFTIASLALAGIIPFAGFFSKDEILLSAGENGYRMFQIVGLVGAVMTAAYMTRCIYLTFFGEPRGAAAHHHPHESPWQITGPLIFLSVLSVVAGWLNATMFDVEKFTQWFEPATVASVVSHHAFSGSVAITGLAAGLLGIAVGYLWYWQHLGPHGVTERVTLARAGYTFLDNKYYLDNVYTDGVVGSIKGPIARAAYWVNQNVIDGVVNAAGIASVAAARFVYNYIDQGLVDGIVNGTGLVSEESGGILRLMQSGRVQQYAAVFFAGVVAFAVALALAT
jgi:NADH-quinone oxidoreductase subunit L